MSGGSFSFKVSEDWKKDEIGGSGMVAQSVIPLLQWMPLAGFFALEALSEEFLCRGLAIRENFVLYDETRFI
ncbi:hypothetical protein ACRQ1B_18575 [Rhizobium panacihumi]|uniref:hypothetical protein n=1 Tax=Rhizobium panacihumi TaxID=2008450 RepID=UPI003D7B351D